MVRMEPSNTERGIQKPRPVRPGLFQEARLRCFGRFLQDLCELVTDDTGTVGSALRPCLDGSQTRKLAPFDLVCEDPSGAFEARPEAPQARPDATVRAVATGAVGTVLAGTGTGSISDTPAAPMPGTSSATVWPTLLGAGIPPPAHLAHEDLGSRDERCRWPRVDQGSDRPEVNAVGDVGPLPQDSPGLDGQLVDDQCRPDARPHRPELCVLTDPSMHRPPGSALPPGGGRCTRRSQRRSRRG